MKEKIKQLKGQQRVMEVRALMDEIRYNPYHDPHNGQFTSGGGGGGGGSVLFIPQGHAGVYKGNKAAMQKSMSSANQQAAERIKAMGGTVDENGRYSFQEHGGLMMIQGQTGATPTATINIQNGNVASQATNAAGGLTRGQNSGTISTTKPSIEDKTHGDCSKVIDTCKKAGVKHNPVADLDHELTEQEIIDRVGGGDKTKGSCVSVAYAYAANKAGYDVADFRGGQSQDVFSKSRKDMADAVTATQYEGILGQNTTPGAKLKVLKSLPEGEEYIFRTGSHAAVVRQVGGVAQYLELQSSDVYVTKSGVKYDMPQKYRNGWHDMPKASDMTERFGKATKKSGYSLVSVKEVVKADGFKDLMGYINTPKNEQQKGDSGYAK